MKRLAVGLFVLVLSVMFLLPGLAQEDYSVQILRSGLLGAASGAIGGAASGAKGRDVWKGALAGAGVNIIGGALLDSITRKTTVQTRSYQPYVVQTQPVTYSQPQYYYNTRRAYSTPVTYNNGNGTYSDAYQEGYFIGYKEGYAQGLKDGLREGE